MPILKRNVKKWRGHRYDKISALVENAKFGVYMGKGVISHERVKQ